MNIIVATVAAFIVTFILLPIIIKVSRSIDLLDMPDKRKIHSISTPSLGGIGIFAGFMLALAMVVPLVDLGELKFFLFGTVIIFLLGVRDDVSSLLAKHKLFTQIFAAVLVVYFADIQLTGFYGMLGIHVMPRWFNLVFSTFVVVAMTNSFNLIDGIDGLAASVAILILIFFGWTFLEAGELAYALVCTSVVGALLAFLFFNWHPSKLFMGDTGSMVLGFLTSTLAIKFINTAPGVSLAGIIDIRSSVALAVALLILPILDTTRVFAIRFRNGVNPLDPDRNHLHHGLLKLGMNHSKATISLLAFNVFIVGLAYWLNNYFGNGEMILILFSTCLLFVGVLEVKLRKRKYLGGNSKAMSKDDLYVTKSA